MLIALSLMEGAAEKITQTVIDAARVGDLSGRICNRNRPVSGSQGTRHDRTVISASSTSLCKEYGRRKVGILC